MDIAKLMESEEVKRCVEVLEKLTPLQQANLTAALIPIALKRHRLALAAMVAQQGEKEGQ